MTQKLIMCKGLPASGKSTWAKEFVRSTPKSVRINNDDLRASFYWRAFNKDDEELITCARSELVLLYLNLWFTVVVDNTNLNPIHQKVLTQDLDQFPRVVFDIKEFAVDVETCVARDKLRSDKVWEKVIRDMAKQWNYYPEPQREFDKVVQSFGKDAFIFDIDGTLAYTTWRNVYDWSLVHTDWVYKDVAEMANILLKAWNYIIICSWREDTCRVETEKWLIDNKIPYDKLFMRKEWDKRKDSIVKYEILTNDIIPHYYVKWVFDDRDQVVKMWREAGLRCYQVNYGSF